MSQAFWFAVGFAFGLMVGAAVAKAQPACEPQEFMDRGGNCVMRRDAPRPEWGDLDGDCQDARQEVLIRDATGRIALTPDGCRVSRGAWIDPYGGGWIVGHPGGRPAPLEVDHIVPRSYAQSSGKRWTRADFVLFYNDPENLIAVSRAMNQWKKVQGPSEWLPPNPYWRCRYVADWLHVAKKWAIPIKPLDMIALSEWRERCR